MYCLDFEFDGEKLSDYGMIICNFDESNGIETISSGSDITFHHVNSGVNRFNLYYSNYDSPYTATFQICKNPDIVHNHEEMYLSIAEISSLQKWLCRKNQYFKFKVYQKDYEHIYWNANFSSKQIELNGKNIGLELTLYTDAPFAFMDEIYIKKDCTESLSFEIYDVSDEEGFIYPNVEIKILENGNFILENSSDNKVTKILECKSGEILKLDGKNKIVSSSLSSHKTLPKDFNYFFPRIFNTYADNKNIFTCNLKCIITISYSPIRKVGL